MEPSKANEVAQRSAADKVTGALNGFKQSCSTFGDKVASGALIADLSAMVPTMPSSSHSSDPRALPKESVVATSNGLAARVSQNERWNIFTGWGATYPGHLLIMDKGAWTTEDMSIVCPTDKSTPPQKPSKKLWAPPAGFEYVPGGSWALVQGPASNTHDENRWRYAADFWLLNSHGTGTSKGGLVRRRVWERPVQLERAVDVRSLRLDLTQSAGLGLSKALLVTRVTPGSPAEAQGLPVGCTVISVSGEAVKSLGEFKAAVQALRDRGDKMSTLEYEVQPPVDPAPSSDNTAADDALTMSEDDSCGEGHAASLRSVDSKHSKRVPPPPKPPPLPTDDFEVKAVPSKPPPSPAKQSTLSDAVKTEAVETKEVKPLALGDFVTWKGNDEDLPPGTIGKIVKLHPEDGDAECLFETPTGGPQTFTFMLNRLDRYPSGLSKHAAARTSRTAKHAGPAATSNILHQGDPSLSFAGDPNFRLSSYFADDHSSNSGGDSRPRPDAAIEGDDDYPTLHQSWPTAPEPATEMSAKKQSTISTREASASTGAKSGEKEKQLPKKKKSLTAAVLGVMATNKAKKKGKGAR